MMHIEIDQSGKVEQLDTPTVVAGTNEEQYTVIITAGSKRKVVRALRKTLLPRKEIWPIMFSILVYKLLSLFQTPPTIVEIDEEYTGKSDEIEEAIKKLLGSKRKPVILCKRVGKHSPAHVLAWKVHRSRKSQSARRITDAEILRLWRQKSRP